MKFLPKLTWAALAVLCLHSPIFSQTTAPYLDPAVTDWLDNPDRADEAVRLIATFDSPESAAAARPELRQYGRFVGPEFEKMPIQGLAVCPEDVERLTQTTGMIGLWRDRQLQGDLHQAVVASSVKEVWTDSDFTALNGGLTVEGRGVGVLVNDSGFDGMDSDINATATAEGPRRLVQNVKGTGQNAWIEDSGADNDQSGGHGTHCMGIVGGDGRKSAGNYKGVAPRAHLIGYGSGAGLFILDVAGGFEYTAQNAKNYNIRVISNSIGRTADTTFTSFDPTDAFSVAAKTLADMNVITVFSSGNSGSADGTITGNFKTSPWVVCVGNGEKNGTLAGSSSRGRKMNGVPGTAMNATITSGGKSYLWENRPTIVAPGSDIVAARSTTGANISTSDQDEIPADQLQYYTIKTGTSMACPHVAGVIALMLEANPQLEWRAIKAILQRTAIPMQEQYHQVGFGFINAHAAVAAAFHGLLNVPAGSDYDTKYGLNPNGNFGFDGEAWKTATLHAQVQSRMKSSVPSVLGVEDGCTGPNTIDDNSGDQTDASAPYFDITTVDFLNETSTTFDVQLSVSNGLLGSPAGSAASKSYYDVHFELTKGNDEQQVDQNTPPLVYIVSAFDDGPLTGKQFKLTARTNDGTTRPYTRSGPGQFYEDVTGVWNTTDNTITWTIPKASLNLQQAPDDNTATSLADRSSRAARAGDKLGRWRAYTYTRAGTTTPDGAGVYNDQASGSCFLNLIVQ